MSVSLIYVYWPNRPAGVSWCDLPFALREAGLAEVLHQAGIDVSEMTLFSEGDDGEELAAGFKLARDIGKAIDVACEAGNLPIVLCGSCSLAALGVAASGLGGAGTGVVWCDAHPDLNTPETSVSGLFEGMALSAAAGLCWRAMGRELAGTTPFDLSNVALFGAREVDAGEAAVIRDAGIPISGETTQIAERLAGTASTYLHLDMDVHNALTVRANRFAAEGGPSVDEVRDVVRAVPNVGVMAVTGLDPAADDAAEAYKIAIDHVKAIVEAQKGAVA
ncbi:MAG: arginase family protein [Pseudomonadota bacterium]